MVYKGLLLFIILLGSPIFYYIYSMKKYLYATCFVLLSLATHAQDNSKSSLSNNRMYRTAIIKVDPNKLEQYKSALLEQMNTAIKLEPGVLSYTVVADKKDLSSITIMEVYMNLEAYQAHILTPHFKKYKETVKDMVLSLTLIDTELIASVQKDDY